jgi:hypothetical protein
MNALVVSLNFNPGHFSHLIANYKLVEEYGYKPFLYVNKSFNKMDTRGEYSKINNFKEIKELKSVELAIFWFPSFRNITEIIRLRMQYNSTIAYVFHEPFDSIKNYYNSGFSVTKILKICLINLINILVILLSHKIILPSSKALNLYKKKYHFINKNFTLIPLIFDDEASNLIKINHKKYISYIGTIAADHAFDSYINFIESSIKNGWFLELSFLIATKNIIPTKEKKLLEPYLSSGRIFIVEGNPMTNEEINGYYNDSLMVWNAYNRSMQSGILPKAYMFGAAIIGSFQCENEFIENHKTGVLVEDNKNVIEIKNAITEILDKKELFFENCRTKFLENFYYKNRMNDLMALTKDKFINKN